MKPIFAHLRSPAIVSFFLVLPFMLLEAINRRNFGEGFPIPLFIFLWLLQVAFMVTLMPPIQSIQAGMSIIKSPILLLIRVVILVVVLWMWMGIVTDQMPCFLGVPSCD